MPVEDISFCEIHLSSVLKRSNEDPTTALHQKYHDGTLQCHGKHMNHGESPGLGRFGPIQCTNVCDRLGGSGEECFVKKL